MVKKLIVICFILLSLMISYCHAKPIYCLIEGPILSEQMDAKGNTIPGSLVSFMSDVSRQTSHGEEYTDLVIIIKSPGGDVWEAMAIYDYIQMLKAKYKVSTIAMGVCASAAMTILQAGDVRYATNNTYLMTHKPLYIFPGDTRFTATDAKDAEVKLAKCNELIIALFAKRMGVSKDKIRKYFRDDLTEMYGGFDAYKIGFVDHVVYDSGWRYGIDNTKGGK